MYPNNSDSSSVSGNAPQLMVINGACARWLQAPDYPEGRPREVAELYGRRWIEGWGSGASLGVLSPSLAPDERFRNWWGRRRLRRCSTPAR